jgi:hypothetical protein
MAEEVSESIIIKDIKINNNGTFQSIFPIEVSQGGTGLTISPQALVNLASTDAVDIFTSSPQLGVSGILPIANGGIGRSSAPSMLTNLSSTTAASPLSASPRPGVTGTLPISKGGTGKTTAADAISNLGINSYVNSSSVASGLPVSYSNLINWSYIKYSNNFAICAGVFYAKQDTSTYNPAMSNYSATFPFTFKFAPAVNINCYMDGLNVAQINYVKSTTTDVNFWARREQSTTVAYTQCYIIVAGTYA